MKGLLTSLLLFATATLNAAGPEAEDHPLRAAPQSKQQGEMITLQSSAGRAFQNYAVGIDENRAAVLLIHEWWGLNDHIKEMADRVAALGYGALAIDLYDGKVASDPDTAGAYSKAAGEQPDVALDKLDAALRWLDSHSNGRVATLGWCFGGGWSLEASLANPNLVDGTVIYYGMVSTDADRLRRLSAPVLGIFATKDQWITPDSVDAFEAALNQAGVPHRIRRYEADHAFANPSGPYYADDAARDAWAKTTAFLAMNLKGGDNGAAPSPTATTD